MSRKLRCRLLLITALASAGAVGAGAAPAQAAPVPTEVVIVDAECSAGVCSAIGRIESPKSRCRSDRKVKALDFSGEAFDTDRSSDRGAWAVRGPTDDGFDKVRAPEKEFEGKRDCDADSAPLA